MLSVTKIADWGNQARISAAQHAAAIIFRLSDKKMRV